MSFIPSRSAPSSPPSGVAASIKKIKKDKSVRRERIAADHVNVQKVERFLLQCYHYLTKHEGLRALLENPSARTKFNEYLAPQTATSGCAVGLHFWVLAGELLEAHGMEERRAKLKVLEDAFCDDSGRFSLTLAHKCLSQLQETTARLHAADAAVATTETEAAEALQAVLLAVKEAHTEILHTMASNNYSAFLQSKQYTCWRSQERGYAVAMALSRTIEPGAGEEREASSGNEISSGQAAAPATSTINCEQSTIASDTLVSSPTSDSDKPRCFFGRRANDNCNSSPSVDAYSTVEIDRLNSMVVSESQWLVILMAAAEMLPVSFSLHAAAMSTAGNTITKSGRGKVIEPADPVVFPCVYLNDHFSQSIGVPRRQLLGRAMGHNVSCASTLNELLVLLLLLDRETDASTITLSNGTSIKPSPASGPASIKATQVSKWMGMQRTNYSKTPFVAATNQQLRTFVETLREGTAAMVNVQLVREDERVREEVSVVLSNATELQAGRRDSKIILSPGSRPAPALGKLGGVIKSISSVFTKDKDGVVVEKETVDGEGDEKDKGGGFTASIRDMLRTVSGSKRSLKVSGDADRNVDKDDLGRPAQQQRDLTSLSEKSSASQGVHVHRNVIMGVKPVLAKDRCSVLYYMVLQLEPALLTDCYRERHQMETLLGLLPDVFPLRSAGDDDELSTSRDQNNCEARDAMPGDDGHTDSPPMSSKLQSAVSYASFFTRVRSFMMGAQAQVGPTEPEGPEEVGAKATLQETLLNTEDFASPNKPLLQQRKTDAGCSPASSSSTASTPVLVRRKTAPVETTGEAKHVSNQTASLQGGQAARPMHLPNYDTGPALSNPPVKKAAGPMHLPNYGLEGGAA